MYGIKWIGYPNGAFGVVSVFAFGENLRSAAIVIGTRGGRSFDRYFFFPIYRPKYNVVFWEFRSAVEDDIFIILAQGY